MSCEALRSPVEYLRRNGAASALPWLRDYAAWLAGEGQAISDAVDRAGTPWLRQHNLRGEPVDEILYPPDYWRLLQRGYQIGAVWRGLEEPSLRSSYLILYVTAFYDPGLACPYTVSLATAALLSKYGSPELRDRFLPPLLRRDEAASQGATWMTEIKGGSDLGAAVETVAAPDGDHFLLHGDKYFASNVGAELALVAARRTNTPMAAPTGVRGLNLFLVPRRHGHGHLNYRIRRLKDKIATRSVPTGEIEFRNSEAWLLGNAAAGVYPILETLNLSRVANSVACVALAQRALADAQAFAQHRIAFGKPIAGHPLLRQQFELRHRSLDAAADLAWEAVSLLDEVWREQPPYSPRFHLFRLVAHLAKFWTAELAVETARWAMEVHGGVGTLQEFRVERWLREAMILAIWEGTAQRQMLDGLEAMERHAAHRLLFDRLSANATEMPERVERHLRLPAEERQATLEPLFRDLAAFTANTLILLRGRLS